MLAGQLRGVPVVGTLAHSFVTSFSGAEVPPDPVSTLLFPLSSREQTPRPGLPGGGASSPLHKGEATPGPSSHLGR